ncbi:MAG TPA: MFS transporter [Steroidobacteraceae bacterium]|nr:MFS transporter [Steroidobacteraceae bacterium]
MTPKAAYEIRMIGVLTLMFGFVFFDRNAMGNLAPFITTSLHLTNGQIGALSSGLSICWAISGFVVGTLSDALGRRKSFLIVTVVIFSVCSVASGLAPSFGVLLASRMLMGLAEGPILPIAQSLVVLESSESRRGFNMGVMQNLGSNLIGSFAGPVILTALAEYFSWRGAFFVAAVPGLICAALVWLYVREPARDATVADVRPAAPGAVARPTSAAATLAQAMGYRNMWICILLSIVMVPWMILGWTFLPTIYGTLRHLSHRETSFLVGVLGISAAVFAFIVPGLSDKYGRKPIMIVFTFIGIFYPLAALYYQGSSWVLAALVFVGWSASGTFPLFMATIPSETIPSRYVATTLGLVMGLGELIGGGFVPWLSGRAADHYNNLAVTMWIASGLAVIATVLTLFLVETAPVKVAARRSVPAGTPSTVTA